MGTAYEIRIDCNEQERKNIEDILGLSSNGSLTGWSVTTEDGPARVLDPWDDFANLISNNLYKLNEIGIKTDRITFWYLYEYEGQCNMEFWPDTTKRLGELGIVLCISCWEK